MDDDFWGIVGTVLMVIGAVGIFVAVAGPPMGGQ